MSLLSFFTLGFCLKVSYMEFSSSPQQNKVAALLLKLVNERAEVISVRVGLEQRESMR